MRPIVIGVAGGSGSGKTTVVQEIVAQLGPDAATVIQHDAYYRDLGQLPRRERDRLNFDHPDALETDLLIQHVERLRAGEAVEVPVYDFATHTRAAATRTALPRSVVLLDGILILWDRRLRELTDIKIFVDTDADLRFIRRLQRDLAERGRTVESVIEQYTTTVRPMHLEFVEPTKRYADLIVPEGGYNRVAIDMIVTQIRSISRAD